MPSASARRSLGSRPRAEPAEAVAYARRRLALDPLDEEAARDLMRRLLDAGDRAAALATSTTGSPTACARTSGSPRRPRPARWPRACARGGAAAARGERERRARRATRAAGGPRGRAGRARRAVGARPRGGAGAIALHQRRGRDRQDAARDRLLAPRRTARTARAAAVDLGGGAPPFGPWAELLAGLARQLVPPPATAEWPEELGRLAPSLPRRLGRARAAPTDVPPDLARARLFEAAVELAEHATQDRPLVLLLDDVHLADVPTLELTAYLARRIARPPGPARADAADASRAATQSTRSSTPRGGASRRRARAGAAAARRRRAPRRPAPASSANA